jgi:predicted RNase H-like nuclease
MNRQAEAEAEAEVDEKADLDSVDSLICAWGTHMRMWFFHAHAILPCA